jgi:cytochrome c-L
MGVPLLSSAIPMFPAFADDIVFSSVVDNSPLDVTLKPGELETDAIRAFRASGRNPYNGQEPALSEGRRLYQARCQACHVKDGRGRLGPSLVTEQPEYSQVKTDVGLFAIIYGGATGSMQPFALQGLRQDNVLKVMAYVTSLRASAGRADHDATPPK